MKILMVGYGAMGNALFKNLKNQYEFTIIDPAKENTLKGIHELEKKYSPDIILIAIKPLLIETVLPEYKKFQKSLFISVAAGISVAAYEKILGNNAKIIRTMPNLAVQFKSGVSAYFANNNCSEKDKQITKEIFEKIGICEELSNEILFDSVTALSGSGPAYIFHLCNCLINAAINLGIDPNLAHKLAINTIHGAGVTLKNSNLNPTQLINNVTSKNGTTEAGLKVLNQNNELQKIMQETLNAAYNRSLELSKLL